MAVNKILDLKPGNFVLCYHGINNRGRFFVSKIMFEKQIEYLTKHYTPSSIPDLFSKTAGKPKFCITFDDGYKNILSVVQICRKYKIKPTVFILSNPNLVKFTDISSKQKLLSVADILFLKKMGWEIGIHGSRHKRLDHLPLKHIDSEISGAKKRFYLKSKIKTRMFSYVKGKFTNHIVQIVKNSGYMYAFSMLDGYVNPSTNRLIIPRFGVDKTHSFIEFTSLIMPVSVFIRKLLRSFNIDSY